MPSSLTGLVIIFRHGTGRMLSILGSCFPSVSFGWNVGGTRMRRRRRRTRDDDHYRSSRRHAHSSFTPHRRDLLKGVGVVGAGAALGSGDRRLRRQRAVSASPSPPAAAGTPEDGRAPESGGRARFGQGGPRRPRHRRSPCSPWTCASTCTTRCSSTSPEGVLGMALAEDARAERRRRRSTRSSSSPASCSTTARRSTPTPWCTASSASWTPRTRASRRTQLRGLTPGGTKKVDDLTVQLRADEANAIFPEALADLQRGHRPRRLRPQGRRRAPSAPARSSCQPERLPARPAVRVRQERGLLARRTAARTWTSSRSSSSPTPPRS